MPLFFIQNDKHSIITSLYDFLVNTPACRQVCPIYHRCCNKIYFLLTSYNVASFKLLYFCLFLKVERLCGAYRMLITNKLVDKSFVLNMIMNASIITIFLLFYLIKSNTEIIAHIINILEKRS